MPFAAAAAAATVATTAYSAYSANQAAGQESSAAKQAYNLAMANYSETQQNEQPYTQLGAAGSNALTAGINNGSLTGTFNPNSIASNAGYQFESQQGQQGVTNSAAAQGLGTSGAALKAAAQYAQGLASTDIGTYGNLFYQGQNNNFSNLLSASNAGQNAENNITSALNNSTNQGTSALNAQGNAAAQGTVGTSNAISGGINNLINQGYSQQLLNQLAVGGMANQTMGGTGSDAALVAHQGGGGY